MHGVDVALYSFANGHKFFLTNLSVLDRMLSTSLGALNNSTLAHEKDISA